MGYLVAAHIVKRQRDVDQSPLLHLVASREIANFLGVQQAPLGLGSFDGMEAPPRKIAGSATPYADRSTTKQERQWWKVW
jgi:hypothetical protein